MLTKNTLTGETQAIADEATRPAQDSPKIPATPQTDSLWLPTDETLESPDPRTRSVWLTQLVLAATVVTVTVLVLAVQPATFARWNFGIGVLTVIVITMATLTLPWASLPRSAVLAIPFTDVLAIGFLASGTELRFSYFLVLPVMWVAMHFGVEALIGILAASGTVMLLDAAMNPSSQAVMRVFIVLLSLAFIGITAHLAMRQARALRKLLQRQAVRLNRTVARRSEQDRRTTEILSGLDTGVARISLTGAVLAVNPAFAELYALDPTRPGAPPASVEYDGLRGMPIPSAERPFIRASRGETFTDVRVWVFTPSAQWRVLSTSSKRLDASESEGETMLLLVHDVTGITHAQRERERLTAIASHELKHPLTVMISTADLALENDDLTPEVRARFETILQASERMRDMTSRMLRSSGTAFSASDPSDELDLRQLLWDSVDSFRSSAAEQGIDLRLTVDEPLPVVADGFRLRQVFDNLVSNAIKYTPAGGGVQVDGHTDGERVVLVFADSGIGIGESDLANVTTPYFRTDAAKAKAGGTGLGLSITKEIVTEHRGTLAIESIVGSGTRIEVRLPRADRDASHGEPVRA